MASRGEAARRFGELLQRRRRRRVHRSPPTGRRRVTMPSAGATCGASSTSLRRRQTTDRTRRRSRPHQTALNDIEAQARGSPPQVRRRCRQAHAKPDVDALKPWLGSNLAKVQKGLQMQARRGARLRPQSLGRPVRFLDDGRIADRSTQSERQAVRCAHAQNALFAGHDLARELGDDRVADRDVKLTQTSIRSRG